MYSRGVKVTDSHGGSYCHNKSKSDVMSKTLFINKGSREEQSCKTFLKMWIEQNPLQKILRIGSSFSVGGQIRLNTFTDLCIFSVHNDMITLTIFEFNGMFFFFFFFFFFFLVSDYSVCFGVQYNSHKFLNYRAYK